MARMRADYAKHCPHADHNAALSLFGDRHLEHFVALLDGINDVLVIPELASSPNNKLQIFDRNGIKVFERENYRDEFAGVANVDGLVLNKEAGLPEGVYFYLASLLDLALEYQGFLFLDR